MDAAWMDLRSHEWVWCCCCRCSCCFGWILFSPPLPLPFAHPQTRTHARAPTHSSVGHVFDVQVTDMNNDGYEDLFITTHQGPKDTPTGAVYVQWKRHVLAYDFPVLNFGMGEASPGGCCCC